MMVVMGYRSEPKRYGGEESRCYPTKAISSEDRDSSLELVDDSSSNIGEREEVARFET
jgi:hypothetical protein